MNPARHPNRKGATLVVGQIAPARGVIHAALLSAVVWLALGWSLSLLP